MLDRLLSAVVALSLALLVWLYARSRDQEIIDNVPLPVQVVLAPAQCELFGLEVGGGGQVLASFSGAPSRVRELRSILQRNELKVDFTLTVPEERLGEGRYSDTVVIESSDVHAPPGITVSMVEGRNRVPVTLHRQIEKRLPVRFEGVGEEVPSQLVVEPATVLVKGPQEVIERAAFLRTKPSELPRRPPGTLPSAAAVGLCALQPELEGRSVRVSPEKVTVRVPAQMRRNYKLVDVPVHFLTPANFPLRPAFGSERTGRVNLTLSGPPQEETPHAYVFVDLTKSKFNAGSNHEPLQVQLPKDFQLVEELSQGITFELQPADLAPKPLLGSPSP